MPYRARQPSERRPKAVVAGQCQRPHRITMVCAIEGHKGLPCGMFAGRLERSLNRFRTTIREIHPIEPCGKHDGEACGQFRLRFDNVLAVDHHMQMAPELTRDCLVHRRMTMAKSRHSYSSDHVEIAPATGRIEPRALGSLDLETDRRFGCLGEMAQE